MMLNQSRKKYLRIYPKYVKRILDVILSLLFVTLFSPLFILISALVKISSPGPIFFTQVRIGQYSKKFRIYKFRTMRIDAPHDKSTAELSNSEDYITVPGKWLRKTSVDELPQLINVFLGQMSIIGPRPLISSENYVNNLRHEIGIDHLKPGISGLAQINGRDLLSDDAKVQYDEQYFNNISFRMDLKILLKTIGNVLKRKDIKN